METVDAIAIKVYALLRTESRMREGMTTGTIRSQRIDKIPLEDLLDTAGHAQVVEIIKDHWPDLRQFEELSGEE